MANSETNLQIMNFHNIIAAELVGLGFNGVCTSIWTNLNTQII